MNATFLMSYPHAKWRIRGGANFRSEEKREVSPRAAMKEWLSLCDAITRAGGHILVMPPPDVDPPLTGMMYTANAGALFGTSSQWIFLLSKMHVAHRIDEHVHIAEFMAKAGLPVKRVEHDWEGQAEVTTLPGNRFILSYGVRSAKESVAEVRALLPPGAKVFEVALREPFFHGDTCLVAMTNRGNQTCLLAHSGALVDKSLAEIQAFVGANIDVIPVESEDALGYACNSLCVNGTVIMPTGLSTSLRSNLQRRGFTPDEITLSELFGKGGGGPRCLVNELRGFVLTPSAPDYVGARDALHALAEQYPAQIAV